jgi:hypothetical protein
MCPVASIRQRERKDGSLYWSVFYTVNGRQTSLSFNDPQEAVEFQTLANKTSPAKALEVWATRGIAANVHNKMLRDLEIRRIGVRGGVMPFGRLIRIERGSLLRLIGEPDGWPAVV